MGKFYLLGLLVMIVVLMASSVYDWNIGITFGVLYILWYYMGKFDAKSK
ncbi:MAG TPA: hypothetical protein VLS94_09025 [Fusibacter sp.]|nr:hypothetical protein [Fusibacter sp.]